MKAALPRVTLWVVCMAFVTALPSCRENGEAVRSEAPKQAHAPAETTEAPDAHSSAPEPTTHAIPEEIVVFESDSEWLRAERLRADVDGGWVTGDFLPERNKIDIHSRGVTQFSVNVGMLPVNWERLVVLGIDGRNTELRRRDFEVYHFARDDHGKWVVLEP